MAPKLHKAIADPKRFAKLVQEYMDECTAKEELATIVGLALKLDCDKGQLSKWAEKYGKPCEHDPEGLIAHAYKKVKAFGEQQLTQKCYSKNAAMSLALGKCMFGWVEQQHVKHEHSGGVTIAVATGVPGSEAK